LSIELRPPRLGVTSVGFGATVHVAGFGLTFLPKGSGPLAGARESFADADNRLNAFRPLAQRFVATAPRAGESAYPDFAAGLRVEEPLAEARTLAAAEPSSQGEIGAR